MTCSFLLGADLRQFHAANTLPADYLFHGEENEDEDADADGQQEGGSKKQTQRQQRQQQEQPPSEIYDLADLTLQCGRRGDALKLYLSWSYHGTLGYRSQMEQAFATAEYLADLVDGERDLVLVSERPPPCLQVCFFYGKGGVVKGEGEGEYGGKGGKENSRVTRVIAAGLVVRGFMVDYARVDGRGRFLRVVVNRGTRRGTVEGLVRAVVEVGEGVW